MPLALGANHAPSVDIFDDIDVAVARAAACVRISWKGDDYGKQACGGKKGKKAGGES